MWAAWFRWKVVKATGDDSCSCCVSSGPRGVALVPTFAIATDADGVAVNLYDAGRANLRLRDGVAVKLGVKTTYPAAGKIAMAVDPVTPHDFSVELRIPNWCAKPLLQVNGQPVDAKKTGDGYAAIRRTWRKGDAVEMVLNLEPRLVLGEHTIRTRPPWSTARWSWRPMRPWRAANPSTRSNWRPGMWAISPLPPSRPPSR